VTPSSGSAIRVVMSKWGDRPHWEFDGLFLGSDEHGDWLGFPAGTRMRRPGAEYVAPVHQVGLVPADHVDRWHLATFHAPGGPDWLHLGSPVEVYVDMTTPPVWDGPVLRAVDLDLDVVRGVSGRVWVDDEDEFAEHRVRYGYPDDVARAAVDSCDRVRRAVQRADAPFDGPTHRGWLERLAALG
jgi:hypothetical protein